MSSNNKNADTDGNKSEYDIIKVPKEHLDLMLETLYLDSESSIFDYELREDITKALDSIEWVSDLSKPKDDSIMADYFEGDECPFCDAEYDDFFIHSDGMGSYSDVVHYYGCNKCEKDWKNCCNTITKEVK